MKNIKLFGFLMVIIGLFFMQSHKSLHAFDFTTVCQLPLTTFSDDSSTFDVSFPPGGGTTCVSIADCPKVSLPANGTVFSVKVDMELADPTSEIGTPYIWIPNTNSGSVAQLRTSNGELVKLYQNGVGDIIASAWASPRLPTESGWIWGAGPVFLIPTGSDVSAHKWGTGPTAIVLKQNGPWTYGGLANHLWSTGGSNKVLQDISTSFMQPFVSYVTPQALTVSLTSETTYDWENEQWFVPINVTVSKVGKIGNQLVSYGAGVSYVADGPDSAPKGWGARFVLTFIFPK